MTQQKKTNGDPEIVAISEVNEAVKNLDNDARARVIMYIINKYSIPATSSAEFESSAPQQNISPSATISSISPIFESGSDLELEGISPAGRKWIARSGIKPDKLMGIFSLGIDEIDLVSKSVPGKGMATRQKNVFLLKGVAAYLGTGIARFTHEQIKEACLHYNAYDSAHFAANVKSMASIVSGAKDSGYTLTPKGISDATTLIKEIIGSEK